jgi:tRNA U34 2-thiouridine synthase MnmA/TrmU
MAYKGEGEVEIYYYIYNKTAKAFLKCKHFQKVGDVSKACRQWNVTCILTGDCVNGSMRSTKRKYLSTRLTRNEVKTVYLFQCLQ